MWLDDRYQEFRKIVISPKRLEPPIQRPSVAWRRAGILSSTAVRTSNVAGLYGSLDWTSHLLSTAKFTVDEVSSLSPYSPYTEDLWQKSATGSDVRVYTGCPRRNVPDFGRVFLMLNYTDITQNIYIQSWTVTELMAREKCGLLAVPRTVPISRDVTPVHCACPSLRVECSHVAIVLWTVSYLYGVVKMPFDACWKLHSNWRRTLWTVTVKQVL